MISFMKVEEKLAMYLIVSKLSTKYVYMQEKMLSHVRDRASSRKWNLPSKAEGFFSFCRNIIPPQPPPVDTYIQQAEANLLHSSTICWVGRVRLLI